MTLKQTEKRIDKHGKSWSRLAEQMKKNAALTENESADSELAPKIHKAKKRYYAMALKLILKCAEKTKSK